jgi:hypothetical protein
MLQIRSPEWARYTIKTLRTVLQWIPSHCGVHGDEQADRLAKHGAGQQQQENPACLTEIKTIIKSLFKTSQQQDSYHQLTRSDQTTIFRLRTGHNRLNQHLNRVMKIISSPMCSCGDWEAEQDTAHIYRHARTIRHWEKRYGHYQQHSRRSFMDPWIPYRRPPDS